MWIERFKDVVPYDWSGIAVNQWNTNIHELEGSGIICPIFSRGCMPLSHVIYGLEN